MSDTQPILYDYWRSSASYRVRIALNLKRIPYETVAVNLRDNAHRSDEHLSRNPQGLVPALQIDGRMLTQSLAIIEYLDETRPEPALLPSSTVRRARARAIAYAIAMDIHPICNLSVVAHIADLAGGDNETRYAWMQRYIGSGLAAVEQMLGDLLEGAFCNGEAPGLVECCLIPQLYNARRWDVDLEPLYRIRRIEESCAPIDAFIAAAPEAVIN